MYTDLKGKTAVVTGSSAGIGLAIARGLAQSGAKVILNSRKQAETNKARDQLLKEMPQAEIESIAADLGHADGCHSFITHCPDCDILVNNLGIYEPRDFFDTTDTEWQRFFDVNVMSGIRLSRVYALKMVEKGWGRIIFISSESACNIPADMIHYGFSKTALLSISRGLAKRLANTGVTVNAVLPGPTLSAGFAESLADEAKRTGKTLETLAREFVLQHRPSSIIQRVATTEEVANMVVYTCSTQASATTGAALRVDGGVIDSII